MTTTQFEARLVEEIERRVPDGAVALFRREAGCEVLTRRAAGPRWRTAERDAPRWLGSHEQTLALSVRAAAPLVGQMSFSTEDGLPRVCELMQVPVVVDDAWWGALLLLRPAEGTRREQDLWIVNACARHFSAALSTVSRRQRESIRQHELARPDPGGTDVAPVDC